MVFSMLDMMGIPHDFQGYISGILAVGIFLACQPSIRNDGPHLMPHI